MKLFAVALEKAQLFLVHGHSPYESSICHTRLQASGVPLEDYSSASSRCAIRGFTLLIAFVDSIAYLGGEQRCFLARTEKSR